MPIQNTEKKLEEFTNAILTKAIEESQGIVRELSQKELDIISKKKTEIEADANRYAQAKISEIRARESYRVNSRITENKRTLLQYREDCANETFAAVINKIRQFTQSPEYLPHLKMLLQQAVEVFGYGFSAQVQLRPEDMRFADELAKSVSGVSLAFSEGSFSLGGLKLYCQARNKLVDMTFDESLFDIMGHFAEITGLRVD
ncbi:MAG: hypothetical protein EOM14_00635 [Clostridia bacterium]|nr:hypothetical protein [Clostridia bacterium]